MKKQIECPICNKFFEVYVNTYNQNIKRGWSMYCSNECRNKGRRIRSIIVNCAQCGKEITKMNSQVDRSKSGRSFCDKSCATTYNNQFKVGDKHPNFINGKSSYRVRAMKLKDKKCTDCGTEDIRILEVHHGDCNRKNNNPDNLIILCANCHLIRHYEMESIVVG